MTTQETVQQILLTYQTIHGSLDREKELQEKLIQERRKRNELDRSLSALQSSLSELIGRWDADRVIDHARQHNAEAALRAAKAIA